MRLDPHVVIANSPNATGPGSRPAWIQLPAEPNNSAGLCLGGEYQQITPPGFVTLREHAGEAEKLTRKGEDLGGC